MSKNHGNLHIHARNTDPTRTKTLRRAFSAKMRKRFRWVRGRIRKALVDLDVMGLKEHEVDFERLPLPPEGAYDFPESSRKVREFMNWIKEQENAGILDLARGTERTNASRVEWANLYIDHSYKQGMRRAQEEMVKAGYNVDEPTDELIKFAFNQPVHADATGLIYSRVYSELAGITNAMDQQISRILADGVAAGKSPRQMAKRISDEIRDIEKKRAITLARTETIRAHHKATINMYKEAQVAGVKIEAEWSTAGDRLVCPICKTMAAEGPYSLEQIEPLIPAHPQCLIDHQVPIYTSEGWKKIADVSTGDLVLTHKGRFQPVLETFKTPEQKPEITSIEYHWTGGGKNRNHQHLSLTSNHPVLIDNKWREAGDIEEGDDVWVLASKCKNCDIDIPHDKRFCSKSCASQYTANNQWSDPNHRKDISRKTTEQMKREYSDGVRDPHDITKKANETTRELVAQGKSPLQREDVIEKMKDATNTWEHRRQSSLRMKENNPMSNHETKVKMRTSLKERWKLNPEKHPNRIMVKKGYRTWVERWMKDLLDSMEIDYREQYHIGSRYVDFAIPSLSLVIECDGEVWHQDEEAERKRDLEIQSRGWNVRHFTGSRIKKDINGIKEELVRIRMNHSGSYHFMKINVTKVHRYTPDRRKTLYNLSVANDNSYVANGIIVHNCRCVALPLTQDEMEKTSKG